MLELLRAAAKFGERSDSRAMPEGILAFEIDYEEVPDVDVERAKLETILEAGNFDLFVLSEEDAPETLILQFPNLQRIQSDELLLKEAGELREALNAFAVTPAIDAPYSEILSVPPSTEGLGDVIWQRCQSNAPGSGDTEWARKIMKVPQAEAQHGVSGQGVRIGQPDTGVAKHDELATGLDTGNGYNFLANIPDPTDPLSKSMSSPGHGTGTSSAVISGFPGQITGTAPGASLIPIRVMNSVVIGLSGKAIASGIYHARKKGCHVITMSLGGLWSLSLNRAVKKATASDMIVLAAAGNCVDQVTFPANRANVIAVAGIDKNKKKWKGSCSGPAVDISAPGENVYVARRAAVDSGHVPSPAELADVNRRGQGTSFAVALTAGVAALWIEHFTIGTIKQAARDRGITVNDLFRLALQHTAERPSGWDHTNMGAGIVDAEKLLNTGLNSLPGAPIATESTSPAVAAFGTNFEGTAFEAEANFLAVDWQIRSNEGFGGRIETALPPAPSPLFAARIGQQQPAHFPVPAAIGAPATPPVPLDQALRRLALRGNRTLESAADISAESAIETLRTEGTTSVIEQAEKSLTACREAAGGLVNPDAQKDALERFDTVLKTLTSDEGVPETNLEEVRATVEALVRLTGRPAIRVKEDGSEILDPRLENWRSVLVGTRHKWRRLTKAVGRIDIQMPDGSWTHAGTGFVMGDGKIMTNRHVIDTFVDGMPVAPGDQAFLKRRKASIIFDPEAEDETTRYLLTDIITAGKSPIGSFVDLKKLDMAVVAMDTNNGHDAPPLPINTTLVTMTNPALTDLLLSGYPAKPLGNSGPASSSDDFLPFWDRIDELFGEEYGKQFLSPGKIMARPGDIDGDNRSWAFTHDATTLAGNSGSAVISLHGDMEFCGLHFGGATLSQNYAHDIAAVLSDGDGVFDTSVLD